MIVDIKFPVCNKAVISATSQIQRSENIKSIVRDISQCERRANHNLAVLCSGNILILVQKNNDRTSLSSKERLNYGAKYIWLSATK